MVPMYYRHHSILSTWCRIWDRTCQNFLSFLSTRLRSSLRLTLFATNGKFQLLSWDSFYFSSCSLTIFFSSFETHTLVANYNPCLYWWDDVLSTSFHYFTLKSMEKIISQMLFSQFSCCNIFNAKLWMKS